MTINLYALFDSKAGAFMPPFQSNSHDEAIRMMRMHLITKPQDLVSVMSDDFVLFCIGTFDPDTAVLKATGPENLGTMTTIFQRQEVN